MPLPHLGKFSSFLVILTMALFSFKISFWKPVIELNFTNFILLHARQKENEYEGSLMDV